MNDFVCYEGEWKDDSFHGKGRFQRFQGSKRNCIESYSGDWKKDVKHGFGVEKSCSGSQKSISLTLPETLKTSRNFWKFCVFDEFFVFSRYFSLSEVMQSHARTQPADQCSALS